MRPSQEICVLTYVFFSENAAQETPLNEWISDKRQTCVKLLRHFPVSHANAKEYNRCFDSKQLANKRVQFGRLVRNN